MAQQRAVFVPKRYFLFFRCFSRWCRLCSVLFIAPIFELTVFCRPLKVMRPRLSQRLSSCSLQALDCPHYTDTIKSQRENLRWTMSILCVKQESKRMKCFQVTLFSLMLCLFEYNFARKSVILGLVKFGLKLQVDRVVMAEFPVPGIFGFFQC